MIIGGWPLGLAISKGGLCHEHRYLEYSNPWPYVYSSWNLDFSFYMNRRLVCKTWYFRLGMEDHVCIVKTRKEVEER